MTLKPRSPSFWIALCALFGLAHLTVPVLAGRLFVANGRLVDEAVSLKRQQMALQAVLEGYTRQSFAAPPPVHTESEACHRQWRLILERPGGRFVVDRSALLCALERPSQSPLGAATRLVPAFRGGRPSGLRILRVPPGGVTWMLGLREGDIVRRVDGWPLDSPETAMAAYRRLRTADSLRVDIERGGATRTLVYTLVPAAGKVGITASSGSPPASLAAARRP